jgi:hypothetical protein
MKIFLFTSFGLVAIAYAWTVLMGVITRRVRGMWVNVHQWSAKITFWMLLLYVVTIEVCADIERALGVPVRHDTFFFIHLALAVSTATAMALMIWAGFDGLKWQKHHAKLAYTSCFTFLGMAITGCWMIWTRF